MYIQTVTIWMAYLDLSVLAKIQGVAHYAKFKNERRILIGYWLPQLRCDVHT